MSLFRNVIKKLKTSVAFDYLSQLFKKPQAWDSEKLKQNISELLMQLDFRVELAQEISQQVVSSCSGVNELTQKLIRETLISVLVEHYKSNTLGDEALVDILNIKPNQCNVFFIIGSNGVGKTSFIAKLVNYLKIKEIKVEKVLLVAGDTFRAGAVNQLECVAKKLKVDIEVPREKEGSSALIYRALKSNCSNYDLIICDSSGRQYNNQNLLTEIQKQHSIIQKILSKPPEETFLVLDSTLGTYAHSELDKIFEAVPLTGLVLTKMDNTTRGGVIYNLKPRFSTPIKFICYGEREKEIDLFDISSVTSQLINTIFKDDLLEAKN